VISQRRLTLRGVPGATVLLADGQHAEGKAMLVVRNGDVRIENIEFRGARVPDGNGAGIRFERGRLLVSGCAFFDNQMGLLTANFADAELTVQASRFGQAPVHEAALAHLLYVGSIARFTLQGSHFSGGRRGHLVKSRARDNRVLYNQLVDGAQGQASYELEFPNGGVALVLGNVIHQSAQTQNGAMLAYGAEGPGSDQSREHRLVLAHNTWVNDGPNPARFVQLHRLRLRQWPAVVLQNNLFVGPGHADVDWRDASQGNHALARDAITPGYSLPPGSPLIGQAVPGDQGQDMPLRPTAQFRAPAGVTALRGQTSWSPGAVQP
jgi:hypothetical protein